MAKTGWDFGKDARRVAVDLSKLPAKNAMAMARVTKAEIIESQPHGFKSLRKTPKDVAILKVRQRGYAAMTFVAGGFITTVTEFGSYESPSGWTIYPQAFTVAGGKTFRKVRYIGMHRIDDTRRKLAEGQRKRGRFLDDTYRIKRMSLAFGAKGGTGITPGGGAWRFSHSAKHKGIPARPFVRAAAQRAEQRSGELYAEQVLKVMGGFK
jgi:hypothetical protein